MVNQQRSITAVLRAEVGQYKQAMAEAAQAAAKVKQESEGVAKSSKEAERDAVRAARETRENWSTVAKPLLAVGGAITAVGAAALKTGVEYNTLQQRVRAGLTTMLGSAQAVNQQMEAFDAFARNSPFARQIFLQAQQQMLAFGIETQKVIPYLEAVQDAVAASGGTGQTISEIVYVMSQISAASKITAVDLMQLGQRGINAAELIGSQMEMTGAQVRDSITAGTLDADDALDALAAGMSEKFGGAADNVKSTFVGAVDRVKAAWRDLSSSLAEPFVGSEGGGIFTALANEVADTMRAFQALPGPVQAAGAVIAGLVGATSLAAGGFLVMAPRIWETKKALDEMGVSGTRGAIILGNAAKAAGILAVAFGTVQAASKVFTQDEIAPGIETWTKALLGAAEGSADSVRELEKLATVKAPSFLGVTYTKDVNGLADAIGKLDAGKWERFLSMGGPGASDLESAAVVVERVDEALASLVRNGNVDEAAELFDYVAKQGAASGKSLSFVRDQLPQYADALAGVANEQRLVAESADEMASATERAAARFGMETEGYIEWAEEMNGVASSFFDIGQAVDDASVSLTGWIRNLEKQNKSLAEFESNAIEAARKGLDEGLLRSLREMGPEGALRLSQLADASEETIARANAAFLAGTEGVGNYANAVLTIPDQVFTEFGFPGADEAFDRAAALLQKYELLDEREVRTFMELVGFETDDIERMLDLLWDLDQTDAFPTTRVVGANAGVELVNRLIGGLDRLDGKKAVAVATTVERTIRETIQLPPTAEPRPAQSLADMFSFAAGGILTNSAAALTAANGFITRYAAGGLRENHVAQIAPAGAWRIWAEEETGGEAYIPLAPSKRPRSRAIATETVARLGGDVTWYANGGITGGADAVSGLDLLRMRQRISHLERDLRETERVGRAPERGKPDTRPIRHVLRGIDRQVAEAELREARAELRAAQAANRQIWGKRHTADTWNAARSAAADFAGNADIDTWTTPAAVERQLQQKLAEMAQFTVALADLKRRGASPWLLEQLMQAGPSRSSIRTARQLAQDTARLRRLNAMASQVDQVAGFYGQMTQDPRFLQSSAAWGALTGAHQQVIERSVNVNISADPNAWAREIRRIAREEMAAMGPGI